MRAVRWLGAFGTKDTLAESAAWEISQRQRQVAAEPLYRGRSQIRHVKIGLEVDLARSVFVKGFYWDAYTVPLEGGVMRHTRNKAVRSWDKFAASFARINAGMHHGEAIFDYPHYTAVIVKRSASERGFRRAEKLAAEIGLPLKILEGR